MDRNKENIAIQKFLQNLPGVCVTDSQSYRIEALRVYLEEKLGDEKFIAAYTSSQISSKRPKSSIEIAEKPTRSTPENSDVADIESILEGKERKYIGLIYQLIVWEDAYYKLSPQSSKNP